MKNRIRTSLPPQRGMTLVELLVAMAIGLVVTLAVTSVVIIGESNKRTTAATNDTNQSGAFAAYAIDRVLRSAGSGFAQSWNLGVFGCKLSATRSVAGTILPRTTPFPAPFANFLLGATDNLRVAPVLIANGQGANGSDVLVVMGGNASMGDVPRPIRSGVAGTNNLRLDNTVAFNDGDIGLVTQNGITDCLIESVSGTSVTTAGNQILPIGGTYLATTATTTSLATFAGSGSSYITTLGNVAAGNAQFALMGIDTTGILFAYDLLRQTGNGTDAEAMQPLADGVTELHAIYGLDTNNDGIVDTWADPGAAGYTIGTLMVTPATLRQIMAVRVALVLRSPNFEKDEVTFSRPKLFANTPGEIAQVNYAAGDDKRHFRYRVIDTTIPLRNMLLLPNS